MPVLHRVLDDATAAAVGRIQGTPEEIGAPPMINAIANDRTPEWHSARSKGVGASEAAAVCGVSPYETPFEVWARKTGRLDKKKSTPVMELGTHCEPLLFDHIQSEHPIAQRSPGLFRHPDHEVV